MPTPLEKAYGCLAALALGDALGMPTEFLTPERIAAEYGPSVGLLAPLSWHPHFSLPTGSVTDDTEQAMALAGVYLRHGTMTAERAADALLAWADSKGDLIDLYSGPATRRALQALRGGADPRDSGKAGTTNGAAMRVAAIGIVHAGDEQAALHDTVEASLPTHGTTLAISAAAAVSFAVAEAMTKGATVDSILLAAQRGAVEGRGFGSWVWTPLLEHRVALAVQLVRDAPDETSALQGLYRTIGVDMAVTESIPTAFALVALYGGQPMPAVLSASRLGGDCDTIGAIAGAVCGALTGIQALDRELLDRVTRVNGLDLEDTARGLLAASRAMEHRQ
jgi:ADP-ribosylglycohydrolase